MRQLRFLFSFAILAVGLGSCGSPPEETASTPSPETSPSATPTASPSPEGSPTPTPGKLPPFKDPLVEEKSNVAAGAGLTQSTKPEERLIQLGRRPNGNAVASAPATTPNQGVEDPFSVLPPLIVQRTPEVGEAPEAPEQVALAVPDLPQLPNNINQRPISWRAPINVSRNVARRTAQAPQQTPTTVPDLPELPPSESLPAWRNFRVPGITPPRPNPGNTGSRPNPGNTAPRTNPRNTAPRTNPVGGRTPPRTIPTLPTAQVPDLPELPNTDTPVAWRDPNLPPPSVQPLGPSPVPAPPVVPPPPSTDLAQAVEVTGVLQVGSETKVILKAPNEPTSRYVNVGRRVSNGQVLVKRVKYDTGGEPIVIFEQNGVEVAKSVGAQDQPTEDESINNSIGLLPRSVISNQ